MHLLVSSIQVYTEGRLIVEFTFDDMMRIRSWHFTVRNHRELIPRSILAMQQVQRNSGLSYCRSLNLILNLKPIEVQ